MSLRDSWPCPFWLGLCSHGDAGLAAPSAGLGWGAGALYTGFQSLEASQALRRKI